MVYIFLCWNTSKSIRFSKFAYATESYTYPKQICFTNITIEFCVSTKNFIYHQYVLNISLTWGSFFSYLLYVFCLWNSNKMGTVHIYAPYKILCWFMDIWFCFSFVVVAAAVLVVVWIDVEKKKKLISMDGESGSYINYCSLPLSATFDAISSSSAMNLFSCLQKKEKWNRKSKIKK